MTTHKARGYLVRTVAVAPADVIAGGTVCAVFQDHYSSLFPYNDIRGYGATEEAAIADLFEMPNKEWFRHNPPESEAELDAKLQPKQKWHL